VEENMSEDRERNEDEDRERNEERGFKIEDKRRFATDGEARDELAEAEKGPRADARPRQEIPELDFSTFILSLVTSAMVHLGEAPHPDGENHKDLPLAMQTIDIIALLREKTQGNLSEEETRLLEDVLYDLRLRYVAAAR
jgi:hypothetical protein